MSLIDGRVRWRARAEESKITADRMTDAGCVCILRSSVGDGDRIVRRCGNRFASRCSQPPGSHDA
jgi:hypothetical protein